MRSTIFRLAVLAVGIGLAMTGCGTGNDRAGGDAGSEVTTLKFANSTVTPEPQVKAFADEVAKLSQGSMKIVFASEWRNSDADFERATLDDVKSGAVDLAWVGARVFDQVGVSAFDPLLAPMLVDSQTLQAKLFDEGIPQQMLPAVGAIGLRGIGIFPGPFRRVMSRGEPLDKLAAFSGKNLGYQDSGVAQQTFTALGATATVVGVGADITALDGVEQQLKYVVGNHFEDQGGKNVVGNLNLWPRPLVIVAGQKTWAGLSAHEQDVLLQAAKAAMPAAQQAAASEDANAPALNCAVGFTLPQASNAHLAELRAAVQPVYATIAASDPANKDVLARVESLKAALGVGPDAASCPPIAGPPDTHELDGVYTKAQLQIVIKDGIVKQYEGTGSGASLGDKGTIQIVRDRVEIDDGVDVFTMTWKVDGQTLTFSDLQGAGADSVAVWTGKWTKQK